MDNKALIADNIAVIVGGRNIADEYFHARRDFSFGDMDIPAIGPITPIVSGFFDEYWNSRLAVPVQAFVGRQPPGALDDARRIFARHAEATADSAYAKRLRESGLMQQLEAGKLPVAWARGEVLFDHPEKTLAGSCRKAWAWFLATIAPETSL